MPPDCPETMSNQPPAKKMKLGNELEEQKRNLPIYPVKHRIIAEIKKSESVIVIGETGSGKTTQIPQVSILNFKQTSVIIQGLQLKMGFGIDGFFNTWKKKSSNSVGISVYAKWMQVLI